MRTRMFCIGVQNNEAIDLTGVNMQMANLSRLDLDVFFNAVQ
jgi:uncharacterized protein YjbI with pentapeptide repeats